MTPVRRTGRTCSASGLRLLDAGGELVYRVSRDRYGPLSAQERVRYSGATSTANRFDTVGTTPYFGDSRQCALAEVLNSFKLARAALAPDAGAAGMSLDVYIAMVTRQAADNGLDHPWAIGADWQMARSIYAVRLPAVGTWVQVDHSDTLAALDHLHGRLVDLDGREPNPP